MKLELKEITKSFTGKQVLKGISLSANSGTAFGILGRNGAGKTTTIRILIMYFARLNGMTAKDAQKTIDFWLERLGMTEYKNKKLNTLSKGNQQKIQLITAIAHDPDIIILDEPFSGLDPVNAMLLEDVVKEEIADGKIVLFSSHQMNYIEEFCDSIAILNGGRIVLSGDLKEIKHSFSNNKIAVLTNEKEKITELYGDRCSQNENGEFIIRLNKDEPAQAAMQRITACCKVDSVRIYEPSLNDIFVESFQKPKKQKRSFRHFRRLLPIITLQAHKTRTRRETKSSPAKRTARLSFTA